MVIGSVTVFSQTNQSLRVSGNGGLGFLVYNISGGSGKPKLSYGGKFEYCYYFTPNWGIGTGVGISLYNTEGYLDGALVSFEGHIDDEGHPYRKDVFFRDWAESQRIVFAEVPFMFHYQYDFGMRKRRKMYIYMGAKFQLPIMANYEVISGELEIQGYYPRWNVQLFGLPNHGFGTQPHKKISDKLELPFNVSAIFGIGFSFEVSKMVDIFVGGTFDYGFFNLKSSSSTDLLYEDKDRVLQYGGILTSTAIDKANTVSVQLEVGARIAVGSKTSRGGIYRYHNNRY